jgi:hypothetical protein
MATVGGNDDNEWQKLPPDQKVQHKVYEKKNSLINNLFSLSFRHGKHV